MAERVLGIDLGIASCGWGGVEFARASTGKVIAAGVRCFDAPLVDKTGEPKSAARRAARGQRRVIRRRRQRMNAVRRLLHESGLLPDAKPDALHAAARRTTAVAPWSLRSAAHERRLDADEFSLVLGHIARHRGFRSNAKSDAGANAPDETSKMKKAMEQTRDGLAQYRSFGDMIANDPKFREKKRNRDKDYTHTPKRSDLEDEVRSLFAAQRNFGNAAATEELQAKFAEIAFTQRPLQDSEKLVGKCPFEADQMRTARRAPSFELFRYLSRLGALELSVGRASRRLSAEEVAVAASAFGDTKTITFKALRKLLDLDPNARFSAPEKDKSGKDIDVVVRTGGAAFGTKTLKDALGDAGWGSLMKTPEKLDRIAEILSFREDLGNIRTGLAELNLDPLIVDALMTACEQGKFNDFTRAGHVSALVCRNIIPHLGQALVYSDACERAGYEHSARPQTDISKINSPVTRRAFSEAIKQVRAVEREHGPFDYVHIELARAVGKSAEERRKLADGLEERTAEKERRRAEAAAQLGRVTVSDDTLLRYELCCEQLYKCIYCGGDIARDGFAENDTRYQVDHILPWSRFGDDSYLNKTICCVRCNQLKKGRTAFEWFEAERSDQEWSEYIARVEALKECKGRKKRNYVLKSAAEIEEKFKARNLTDTQWVTRLLADELKRMYPPRAERRGADGKDERRVFARPGAITSKLRRAWGLNEHKKDDKGERVSDDRHHAVDALVLAATTESLLQQMTKEVQQREKEGREDDIFHVPQPWPGYRLDVTTAVYGENGDGGVFVSRAERRRARGKAHDATIKQIREIDGERIVYERKAVEKLTEKDLEFIPIPSAYGKAADPQKLRDEMVLTLREWLNLPAAERKKNPPRSSKGDVIRKVRLQTKDKVAVPINGGTVDRGDMARVDVFRKRNKKGKWEFYVVPIYPHQIATLASPPIQYVQGATDMGRWPEIDATFEFVWSLTPMNWVRLVKSNEEVVAGYFRGLDIATAAINLSKHDSNDARIRSQGVKTLSSFKKFNIDRLGRKSEVLREVRTWRGRACT